MMQWLIGSAMQWVVGFVALAALLAAGVGVSWLAIVGWTHIKREVNRGRRRKRRRYNA